MLFVETTKVVQELLLGYAVNRFKPTPDGRWTPNAIAVHHQNSNIMYNPGKGSHNLIINPDLLGYPNSTEISRAKKHGEYCVCNECQHVSSASLCVRGSSNRLGNIRPSIPLFRLF
jgi:hypothetical protein